VAIRTINQRLVYPNYSAGQTHTARVGSLSWGRSTSNSVAVGDSGGFPNLDTVAQFDRGALTTITSGSSGGSGWGIENGEIAIRGDGVTLQNFTTTLTTIIYGNDVTVRNAIIRVAGPSDYALSLRHTTGAVIDNIEVGGQSNSLRCDNAIRGIYGDDDDVTITNSNISWCASGVNHLDLGGLIEDNFIHDLGVEGDFGDPDFGHFNGIQLGAGFGPLMTINHNTIFNEAQATDCIMLAADDGAQTNRTITNNLIGGGGYSFYGSGWVGATATNIIFTGNRFTTQFFPNGGSLGPVAHWQAAQSGNVWSDNKWYDGPNAGVAINP
jgi:hypothetical protein